MDEDDRERLRVLVCKICKKVPISVGFRPTLKRDPTYDNIVYDERYSCSLKERCSLFKGLMHHFGV